MRKRKVILRSLCLFRERESENEKEFQTLKVKVKNRNTLLPPNKMLRVWPKKDPKTKTKAQTKVDINKNKK